MYENNQEVQKLLAEGWTEYGAGEPPVANCQIISVNDKGHYRRFWKAIEGGAQ